MSSTATFLTAAIACLIVVAISPLLRKRKWQRNQPIGTGSTRDDQPIAMAYAVADEPLERLVEAIACWRIQLPESRTVLAEAAVDLLVAGDDSPSVVELASLYPNEDWFTIDALVERLVVELDLQHALSSNPDAVAIRRVCRSVLLGTISPRELTQWAHVRFHHQSDSGLINELAELDDTFDGVDDGWSATPRDELNARVREIARTLIGKK